VSADVRPKSAVSALDHCGPFLNMKLLLHLLATLPITTAEAQRVFSKMEIGENCNGNSLNNGRESARSSSTSLSTP